jgi:hypothetical protein
MEDEREGVGRLGATAELSDFCVFHVSLPHSHLSILARHCAFTRRVAGLLLRWHMYSSHVTVCPSSQPMRSQRPTPTPTTTKKQHIRERHLCLASKQRAAVETNDGAYVTRGGRGESEGGREQRCNAGSTSSASVAQGTVHLPLPLSATLLFS